MPGIPNDWNVVVRGAWNAAILTPAGIARRLFQLDVGTPVEVHVAMDQPSVARVIHDGTAVMPSLGQLLIAPVADHSLAGLHKAAHAAELAITTLPETPLLAVGVNVKFDFDALSEDVTEMLSSTLDTRLADDGKDITERLLRRTVKWNEGFLNLEVDEQNSASGRLSFNFHRASDKPTEHIEWLQRCDAMVQEAERLAVWFGV